MTAIAAALGYSDIRQVCRNDLVALTPEAAAMTRLPYRPAYRAPATAADPVDAGAPQGRETASANYTRRDRRAIRAMAGTAADDLHSQRQTLKQLLVPRENPFPADRPASLDDVVFLSAALTRLVIDPYREACNTATCISRWMDVGPRPAEIPALTLAHPFFFTGFDDAPANVRQALAAELAAQGCGYIGRRSPTDGLKWSGPPPTIKWLQLLSEEDKPDPSAAGLIGVPGPENRPIDLRRQSPDQLLGLVTSAGTLEEALSRALDNQLDMLVLDSSAGITTPWVELKGPPDLTLWRDAISKLRQRGREEEIALLNFGGMRTGTDVAKALAVNCTASVFSLAAGLALGGAIAGNKLVFQDDLSVEALAAALEKWIRATSQETAIIARCTGKTNVHNLEPEDMRGITLAAQTAIGIPLASGQAKREGF